MSKNMRGQVGLEFFLILGFCLAMLSLLIANSERSITDNERLDSAVLSLSALNSVSNAINTVAIQGDGAKMTVSAFVPSKSKCYLPSNPEQRLSCDIGDAFGRRVYGMRLMAMPDSINNECYTVYGWMDVTVTKSSGKVSIFCSGQA
jgi:hypothetical protein